MCRSLEVPLSRPKPHVRTGCVRWRTCHDAACKSKGARIAGPLSSSERHTRGQFTRVQVWPPQNMPPKAQPCTRRRSVPFIAIVES